MNKSDLFDMSKAYGNNYLGYWVDENYNVYSTKQKNTPYKLARQSVGCNPYYGLSTNTGSWGNRTSTLRVCDMRNFLDRDAGFKLYKTKREGEAFSFNQTPASNKAFIVGSMRKDGTFSFAMQPKVHQTEDMARAETERLAKTNPGTTYVYLEVKGRCKAGGVTWN